jgi:UDP-N-acetylglucosamine 2-epimerase (non-hydrolysing)
MQRFEPVVLDMKPDWTIVYGDVNSTLACGLVCAKLGVPVAHVEAGLRSFDRTMPEEVNRLLTDQLSELLFTTEQSAGVNLAQEGIAAEKVHFVGNVMIDSLVSLSTRAKTRPILSDLRLLEGPAKPATYVLVTLHRPTNVDNAHNLGILVEALAEITTRARVLFPVHPRTRQRLEELGLVQALKDCLLLEPLGYLDFLALQMRAALVITDSGGVQEETTFLGIPCLTVRRSTERPVTVSRGTNRLVECSSEAILRLVRQVLDGVIDVPREPPPMWDGRAAGRIARILLESGYHNELA